MKCELGICVKLQKVNPRNIKDNISQNFVFNNGCVQLWCCFDNHLLCLIFCLAIKAQYQFWNCIKQWQQYVYGCTTIPFEWARTVLYWALYMYGVCNHGNPIITHRLGYGVTCQFVDPVVTVTQVLKNWIFYGTIHT